ncbi:RidA family protein [Bacteroidota bacterium]
MKTRKFPLINYLFLIFLLGYLGGCTDSASKLIIKTENAPKAIGPYSQAVQIGNTIYVAGQIPIDPETNNMVEENIEDQTHMAIKNVKAVLNYAGYGLNDVVQCQIFLADLNHYSQMNEIYASYFKKDFPARAVVEVKRIPRDSLIEIMVVAVK